MPHVLGALDAWLRHRLRMVHLLQWERGRTAYAALNGLGASPPVAGVSAANMRRWRRHSAMRLNSVLPIGDFDRRGLPRLS
jgi:RNA-directed DNA polymerase